MRRLVLKEKVIPFVETEGKEVKVGSDICTEKGT